MQLTLLENGRSEDLIGQHPKQKQQLYHIILKSTFLELDVKDYVIIFTLLTFNATISKSGFTLALIITYTIHADSQIKSLYI